MRSVPVGKRDRPRALLPLDLREVPPKRRLAVLRAERMYAFPPRSERRPQLTQVVAGVGDGHEASTGPQHAGELPQPAIQVGNVVKHPGGHRAVEGSVGEGKRLDVADARIDAARPRQLGHSLGLVERDELGTRRSEDPLGKLPSPGAHLEHAARCDLGDCFEGEVPRIGSG